MKSILAILAVACAAVIHAEVRFGDKTRFRIATPDEGRAILSKSDDFTQAMSSFDRTARMKSDHEISEEDFLKFAGTNVLEFSAEEAARIEKTLESLKPAIEPLKPPFPETVLIVKTTGNEESNESYVRGNAIIVPKSKLAEGSVPSLEDIFEHELFHVISRNAPELREKLYGLIGFHKCAELKFPPSLMRLTTPDAPHNDHWIEVQANGGSFKGIPITTARPQKYDPKRPGDFFSYLRFKLMVVRLDGDTPKYDAAKLQLTDTRGLKSYHDQIGDNTQYAVHPEEILAENFRMLLKGGKGAHTPELLTKIREAFEANAKTH